MATSAASPSLKPSSSPSLLPQRSPFAQCMPRSIAISIPHSTASPGFRIHTFPRPGRSRSFHHKPRCFPCLISAQKLEDTASFSLPDHLSKLPPSPGIYAVYDKDSELQFIGLTRRISSSLSFHVQAVPELCSTVKVRLPACSVCSFGRKGL